MLVFAGKQYASNDSEFIDTLFTSGGTANGYYKRVKHGIYIYNMQNELEAFIKAPLHGEHAFVVTATKQDNGKPRYMFSTSSLTEKFLGIGKLGYMEKIEACNSLFTNN